MYYVIRLFKKKVYKQKQGYGKKDGNCIFFKTDKFTLKKSFHLNFKIDNNKNYNAVDEFSSEMYYPSVAQFALLKYIDKDGGEDSSILIINTHLVFNKNTGHLKLAMITLIIKTILRLTQIYKINDIFFCGDFNSIPNSLLYDLLSKGKIDLSRDLREYSNQHLLMEQRKGGDLDYLVRLSDRKFNYNTEKNYKTISLNFLSILYHINIIIPKMNDSEIKLHKPKNYQPVDKVFLTSFFHSISSVISFKSAYAEFNRKFYKKYKSSPVLGQLLYLFDQEKNNNDAYITQFSQDMVNTVDYIWFGSNGKFKLKRILQMPDVNYLKNLETPCPTQHFGSDHFSLVVDFYKKD